MSSINPPATDGVMMAFQRRPVVAAALMLVLGCARGNPDQATAPRTSGATATVDLTSAPPSPTASPTRAWQPKGLWSFSFGNDLRYTSDAWLELGAIGALDEVGPLFSGRDTIDACQYDPQRDLVVPARAYMLNTTPNFPLTLGISLYASDAQQIGESGSAAVTVDADFFFTDGAECESTTPINYPGAHSANSISCHGAGKSDSGERVGCEWYLIIHNARTPADPDGVKRASKLRLLVAGNFVQSGKQVALQGDGPCLGPKTPWGFGVPFEVLMEGACPPWS